MMTWKEKAQQALDERTARQEAERARQQQAKQDKQRKDFHRALEALLEQPVPVEAMQLDATDTWTVEIDGVTFGWLQNQADFFGDRQGSHQFDHYIAVWGQCRRCDQSVWSGSVRDLADLGERLERFTPDHFHTQSFCQKPRA